MKYILLLAGWCISTTTYAQQGLVFNKRFVECEDKWVAFAPGSKDSSYMYGFIYIDAQAGLTFNYEGSFTMAKEGKFIPKSSDSISYKIRLEPNNVKVALIPESRFAELKINAIPEWLHFYKDTKDTVGRMVRWGYYYNHWDMSEKALTYLEPAYELDPNYKSLEFELSFAYNALGRYAKAVTILQEAVKKNPAECVLYKELSFAEIQLGQLDAASISCYKGIDSCPDKQMKAEIAYNMAYSFYKIKDKDGFKKWVKETKKWASDGDQFMQNIKVMETNLRN